MMSPHEALKIIQEETERLRRRGYKPHKIAQLIGIVSYNTYMKWLNTPPELAHKLDPVRLALFAQEIKKMS